MATWYDSAWIGGTASGSIFIQICDCAHTKHLPTTAECIMHSCTEWRSQSRFIVVDCLCPHIWTVRYLLTLLADPWTLFNIRSLKTLISIVVYLNMYMYNPLIVILCFYRFILHVLCFVFYIFCILCISLLFHLVTVCDCHAE